MKMRAAKAYVKGEKTGDILLIQVQGVWMEQELATAFINMAACAKDQDIDLEPTSGFRSMKRQTELYTTRMDLPDDDEQTKAKKKQIRQSRGIAARPGYSRHQNGTALDIRTGGAGSDIHKWLQDNAHHFHFETDKVRGEPWHLEFTPRCDRTGDK